MLLANNNARRRLLVLWQRRSNVSRTVLTSANVFPVHYFVRARIASENYFSVLQLQEHLVTVSSHVGRAIERSCSSEQRYPSTVVPHPMLSTHGRCVLRLLFFVFLAQAELAFDK